MSAPAARVGVVGAGLMGSGIVEVSARSGCAVVSYEIDRRASDAGRTRLESSLDRAVARGKIDAGARDATLGRIRFTTDLSELADRQFVFEAVIEDEGVKLDLFGRLDALLEDPDAVLATNTSSIPVMKLAMATQAPERVVGVHFFNPAPVQRLVELVPSLLTSDATVERARGFATEVLGKSVIRSQDRAGFIVNSLLVPYILSAIRMFDSGFASAEDIDRGMELGCAHPMGPLRLADLIGLDTLGAIAEAMYEEFKEQLYFAPPVLLRMVEAGLLGRKTGRGFYEYA
ncbi:MULTISPECIES: 3-hydroxybutyryl-CoA dehydrogenase [unclassified Nocardioides]|uniref:3-hydroxybutyryl-CoA dehydrogenase n=1 Tax=unclassified Nocardioides TaxID=2615069 RepID=UPI00005713EE|nr:MULTISPECIES: 3-hydroxybutyryl-CoA dehydrogenase [unclassified Nocardioides]ABL83571.1 3-hydroxyacyl-CoA dehydrogenase [Nocardioides sp. JS614]